jgi:hypothetical protein
MSRWRRLRLCLCLVLLTGALASPALAQQRVRLTVVVVDRVGFSGDELFELQYGLEQIVADFGEVALVSAGDRESALTPRERDELAGCRLDVSCYARLLYPLGIDAVVAVETAQATGGGYVAFTTGMDLSDQQILSEHQGNFPDPGNSLFLLAPMFETMEPLAPASTTEPPPRVTDRRDDGRRDDRRDPAPLPLPPDRDGTNVLATALIAGGGVLAVTGVIFWMLADDTLEDIQSAPHSQADLAALQDTGESQQTIGNIAFFGGLALLATGVVFELTGIGKPSRRGYGFDDDDWVRLQLSPGLSPWVGIEVDF